MNKFDIFADNDFDQVTNNRLAKIRTQINTENNNYLLNVNQTEYVNHLTEDYLFSPLEIGFENYSVGSVERDIPGEFFGPGYFVERSKHYRKQVVIYHVPFIGDQFLLKCTPNPRLLWSCPVWIEAGEICFEIINFRNDPEEIKSKANSTLNNIRQQYQNLANQISTFNSSLQLTIQGLVESRRNEILKQNDLVAALGAPFKKSVSVPETFAVPKSVKKKITPRPSASVAPYSPEPTLDQSVYQKILEVIHDTGKGFERLPSTYKGKNEETLRDHLILVLEPNVEGSTTGETFNKNGKTDILVRYEGKNIFVAECKFWRGEKEHFKTINQILSYLTWRDSKAAIIYFIDNKKIIEPLKTIEATTQSHTNFIATKDKTEESWFNYEFHLPDDNDRSVRLAVLCFHLPRSAKS